MIIKRFEELSTEELYKILEIRNDVFIVEQNCPYQDIDQKDKASYHCYYLDDFNNIIAYARLLDPSISYKDSPSIGRVLVNMKYRKQGYGRKLMIDVINASKKYYGNKVITISAQLYLLNFYSSLGFVQVGESYLEDDIPHIKMTYTF